MTEERKVFDREAALGRMEGDEELLADMVQIFLEDYPNQLKAIERSLSQSDAVQLVEAAHAFKGSVGNFGADRAFAAARELEQLARENRSSEWDAVWQKLQEEIRLLDPLLRQVVNP